jgi:hypothetical protein
LGYVSEFGGEGEGKGEGRRGDGFLNQVSERRILWSNWDEKQVFVNLTTSTGKPEFLVLISK